MSELTVEIFTLRSLRKANPNGSEYEPEGIAQDRIAALTEREDHLGESSLSDNYEILTYVHMTVTISGAKSEDQHT